MGRREGGGRGCRSIAACIGFHHVLLSRTVGSISNLPPLKTAVDSSIVSRQEDEKAERVTGPGG